MVDYAKAAFELKTRLNARIKRKNDLDAFFAGVKSCIKQEMDKANEELVSVQAPKVELRQESPDEPTIELSCGSANCKISQDRSVPSIGAIVTGITGEKTLTFLILTDEEQLTAQRVSLAPANEPKVDPAAIAATLVEELIGGAP